MKEKFLSEYIIVNMNNKSLTVENRKTHKKCFIHRNAFNSLDVAVDFRELDKVFIVNGNETESTWIEVLTWKTM